MLLTIWKTQMNKMRDDETVERRISNLNIIRIKIVDFYFHCHKHIVKKGKKG